MIAYLIGGPQDMMKTLVSDKEFKNRTLTFPHAKVAGLDALREAYGTRAYLNTPGVVENAVYVKVYETHRQGEPYAVYVYSPDGLVP